MNATRAIADPIGPIFRNPSDLLCVALSADGIFIGSRDGKIRRISRNGDQSTLFKFPTDSDLTAMTVSRNGKYAAVGFTCQDIQVLDLDKDRIHSILNADEAARLTCLRFSDDTSNRFLGAGFSDGCIQISATATFRVLKGYMFTPSGIMTVGFADRTRTCIAGSSDGKMRFFDAFTGRMFSSIPLGTPMLITDYCGKLILSASQNCLIVLTEGGILRRIQTEFPISTAALSPDGKRFAIGSTDSIYVGDLATGRIFHHRRLQDGPVVSLAYSTEGTELAACSKSRNLFLLDAL